MPNTRPSVVEVAKRTFKDFKEDDLQGAAAEVVYHVLFALAPLLLFVAALSGFVSRTIGIDDVTNDVTVWLRRTLPDSTAEAVITPIEEVLRSQAGGILSFGVLTALWGGKNAMATLMKALNVAFDAKETRPWWKQQLVAIGLTVGLGLALIVASLAIVLGSGAGGWVADQVGAEGTWPVAWSYLRWPVVVVLVVVALGLLYWAAPDVEAKFRWLTPGAVLTVFGWAVASFGLSIYFTSFAGYTAYGALGAVMAFIFWLYVMGLVLLLGGEVNAVVGRMAGAVAPHESADCTAPAASAAPAAAAGATGRRAEPVGVREAAIARDNGSQARPPASPNGHRRASNRAARPRAGELGRRVGRLALAASLPIVRLFVRGRRSRAALDGLVAPVLACALEEPQPTRPRAVSRAEFGHWEDRTVGEFRSAVAAGQIAKTELQLYGMDWSQLASEPDQARLDEVFARRGAVLPTAPMSAN
jgi:membrane protein